MKRHPEAYAYLRLLWKPQVGHRVYFEGRKQTVAKVVEGKGIRLKGQARYIYSGQALWRPTPEDFNAVLSNLPEMWIYRQLLDGNRQVVGISLNGRTLSLRGRPVQILSKVLAMRVVDSKISIIINNLFEKAYTKDRNVPKLHVVQKTGNPP
jgi:hypothetical protein